jgi:hypothetical protein
VANRFSELSAALDANLGRTSRAEKEPHYLPLFVDPINIATLQTSSNQLIYGRRGAGKTMMFRALDETITASREEDGIYSFYYSAVDFRSSPDDPSGQALHIRTIAHRYFHAFIQLLVDDMLGLMDRVMASPRGRTRHRSDIAKLKARRIQVDNLGLKLLEASGYGTDAIDLATAASRRSVSTSTQRKSALAADLQASTTAGIEIGGTAHLGRSGESTVIDTTDVWPARHFEPHVVRECLHEMLEILGVKHIVILIDEWMSLTDCQVHFAERLKQCLFGEPRIAVKIAADQYHDRLNDSAQGNHLKGLEIGADISLVADLDAPFRDPSRSRSLFATALYRRLLDCEPNLVNSFGPPDAFNEKYFLSSLFSTTRAFDVLCYSAQGLCRDFFEVFEEASKKVGLSVSAKNRMSIESVEQSISDHSKLVYSKIEGSVDLYRLFQLISELLERTRSRYFVVPMAMTSHDDLLRQLMQRRVIHGVDRALLHQSIRAQYRVFEIDFGVSIETTRTDEYATGERPTIQALASEVQQIRLENVEKYIADLDLIQREETVQCTNSECRAVFAASEESYVIRSICPKCYQDVETREGA